MPPIIINPSREIRKTEQVNPINYEIDRCDIVFICALAMILVGLILLLLWTQRFLIKIGVYTGPEESKIRKLDYTDMADEIFDNINIVVDWNYGYIQRLYNTFDDYEKTAKRLEEYMKNFVRWERPTNQRIQNRLLTIADRVFWKHYSKKNNRFSVPYGDNDEEYFVNGISAIIDKMDGFISGEKVYIDKLDKDDEDLKKLHKKMNEFLMNGRQFIRIAKETRKKTGDGVDNL